MNDHLISVLMVNYNHEHTIKKTIKSVLNQTYKNIQFIIVDDGSTDLSCNIVEQFDDKRIELYKLEKNEHICYATNVGFDKVKGKYLARIDSDDIWYPNFLEKQMMFMEEQPERKICFTWCDWIDEEDNNINHLVPEWLGLCDVKFNSQREWLKQFYFEGNCLMHSAVVMETELMREIGGFEPAYRQLHDFDYWVRIAKRYNIYIIPERLACIRKFRTGRDNASTPTKINTIRTFNEYMDIRATMFDGMSDETFIEAFGDQFVCSDSRSEEELKCEKAFMLCKPQRGWDGIPPEGIRRLKSLFESSRSKVLLEDKYHFSIKDLYELTSTHIYSDPVLKEEYSTYIGELNEKLQVSYNEKCNLQKEVLGLNEQISVYKNSTSWKVTRPLRFVGKMIRGITSAILGNFIIH